MKKWLRRILKWCGILLLAGIAGTVGFRFLYARDIVDSPNACMSSSPAVKFTISFPFFAAMLIFTILFGCFAAAGAFSVNVARSAFAGMVLAPVR